MPAMPPTYVSAADNPRVVDAAVESWRRYDPRVRVERTTRLLSVLSGQATVHVAVGWPGDTPRQPRPSRGDVA